MSDGLADTTGFLSAAGQSIAQYADNFGGGANAVVSPGSQASSYQAPTGTSISSSLTASINGKTLLILGVVGLLAFYLYKRG